jgi:hypothetical protein
MAKLQALMFKCQQGATDLTLQSKVGQSILIKDILIYNPASNYITCKVDKDTVGYFRVGGNLGNHLDLPIGSVNHSHGIRVAAADGALTEDHALMDAFQVSNAHISVFSDRAALTTEGNILQFGAIPKVKYQSILSYLGSKQIFKGFPVSEGETLLITGANQAGAIQLVIYELYDAGDIKNTDENGTKADSYIFLNYGRVAAAIVTGTSTIYGTVQSPAEYPDFPYGKTVPAKTKITLYGVLGTDIVDYRSAADCLNSEYLKFVKGRETLFDEDKNGILFKGITGQVDAVSVFGRGISLIGNLSSIDGKEPFMFPEPLVFSEGDELNVYITTVAGAAIAASTLAAADTEIALICKVEKVA